jgi:hypothetical protein
LEGIQKTTGVNVAAAIIEHIESEIRKKIEPPRRQEKQKREKKAIR